KVHPNSCLRYSVSPLLERWLTRYAPCCLATNKCMIQLNPAMLAPYPAQKKNKSMEYFLSCNSCHVINMFNATGIVPASLGCVMIIRLIFWLISVSVPDKAILDRRGLVGGLYLANFLKRCSMRVRSVLYSIAGALLLA